MIGRFKPLHKGHEVLLKKAYDLSDRLIVGIGSSNKYDLQNPFTASESEDMVKLVLPGNKYDIVAVDDIGNLPLWGSHVRDAFGTLDGFISGNPIVWDALKEYYPIILPCQLLPYAPDICATQIREAMLDGSEFSHFVPACVYDYLLSEKLVDRYITEFGDTFK